MTTPHAPTASDEKAARLGWAEFLICAQAVFVVAACVFAAPVGFILTVLNAVAAFIAHGRMRRLFAAVAALGLVTLVAVALTLLPVAPTAPDAGSTAVAQTS